MKIPTITIWPKLNNAKRGYLPLAVMILLHKDKRCGQTYCNRPDLPYLSIHDMIAATKINSFETDRCQWLQWKMEQDMGKEESHLHGDWIFKSWNWNHVCYACSSHLLTLRFHNSQYVCTTEIGDAQAEVHHLWYLYTHANKQTSWIPFHYFHFPLSISNETE